MLLLHLLNEYLARFSAVTLIVETKQYQPTTSNGLWEKNVSHYRHTALCRQIKMQLSPHLNCFYRTTLEFNGRIDSTNYCQWYCTGKPMSAFVFQWLETNTL